MSFITNKAVIIIDGVEYPNNDLMVNDAGNIFTIALDYALDHLEFGKGKCYWGPLVREDSVLEYDMTANYKNGHVMNFKLRFPAANITVTHGSQKKR